MKQFTITERVLGYAIRIYPSAPDPEHFNLSWSSVSIDTDFWPLTVDPSKNRRTAGPFPELWSDLDEVFSNYQPASNEVIVAITLPYFQGCEDENGYRDFVEMTEGWSPSGLLDDLWINTRPIFTTDNEKRTRMGYDISFAGCFKSILLVPNPDIPGDWKMDVPAKRTPFGLFDKFTDAYAYSINASKEGIRSGQPAEETHLWPLGLWLIKP